MVFLGYVCRQKFWPPKIDPPTWSNVLSVNRNGFISVGRHRCALAHLHFPATVKTPKSDEATMTSADAACFSRPPSYHQSMLLSFDAAIERITGASAVIPPAVLAVITHYRNKKERSQKQRVPRIAIRRQRGSVADVFQCLGPSIFRRAFRMTFDSFWRLYSILSPHILSSLAEGSKYVCKGGRAGGNYSLPPIRNGPIPHSIRLGASLRYFAGGSPYDIMYIFGISYSGVLRSVWTVVDAVHRCPKFDISYLDTVDRIQA